MTRVATILSALLTAAPLYAQAPVIDWDGGAFNALPSAATVAPAGRRELPENTEGRLWREISGPGGAPLLEAVPLYNPDGSRAKYQPHMTVGIMREPNVIEWYPVRYGYYFDGHGRLVKGLHTTIHQGGVYASIPWADTAPSESGIAAYAFGENPVFHPHVGRVPLKRVERTSTPALPKPRRSRSVQY